MTDRARPSGHPPHGSLAEEAAKLAEVAQQWLGARSRAASPDDVWADATAEAGPETCRGCPVCRARSLLTGVSPEVLAHLSDAAASLGAAVRAMGERTRGQDTDT